jgi:hypothetical protein
MSAIYILEYCGAPVAIVNGSPEMVRLEEADQYTSQAEAWHAAYRAGMKPERTDVASLSELVGN